MAKKPAMLPAWVQTVGAMKDADAKVQASCSTCGRWRQVNYDRLIAAKGRDYSLIGRRCRCTMTPGCTGWVKFSYLNGVFRPLREDRHIDGWMARDAARRKGGAER